MIHKMPAKDPNKVLVRFELPPAIWADCVNLVGDFNSWSETSHPLSRDRNDATWYIVLELERNRQYEFRYLVNGHDWHNDWKADGYSPNPYGGTNSVVSTHDIPPAPEAPEPKAMKPGEKQARKRT